jgi:MAP/microtubule affinity-regulating kinase
MLKSLRHKNIVNIYKCYTLANMQVVFIMEYLEGGELLSFLEGIVKLYKQEKGRLNEDEARVFIKQIAEAVQYCHQ